MKAKEYLMSSQGTTYQTSLSGRLLEQSILRLRDIYDQKLNERWSQLRNNIPRWISDSSSTEKSRHKYVGPKGVAFGGQ